MRSAGVFGVALWLVAICSNADAQTIESEVGRSSRLNDQTFDVQGLELESIAPEAGENPFEDEIETDRDSFTPATSVVRKGKTILESAYSFVDNRGVRESHSLPELIVRYGLSERIELRIGWNYEVGGAATDTSGVDAGEGDLLEGGGLERESSIAYGVKLAVTDQRLWRPKSAIILQGFTPTSGEVNDSQLIATYVFGWELPYRWKLDCGLRYGTASEQVDHFHLWAPSVVLKAPIGRRWNVHAEYFGIMSSQKEVETNRQYFSPGVHYLITPDLEVGVRVGWGLNDETARFFSNVGFGLRF
jgi:hypothetical protein